MGLGNLIVRAVLSTIAILTLGLSLLFTESFSSEFSYSSEATSVVSESQDRKTRKEGKLERTSTNDLLLETHLFQPDEPIELQLSDHWVRGHVTTDASGYWYFVSEKGRKTGALSGRLARLIL